MPYFIFNLFINYGVDQSLFRETSNPALDQLNQQVNAYWAAINADYDRQIGRFDRKLAISLHVVASMNISYQKVSKFPRTKYLYKRSGAEYKKLEILSQKAANAAARRDDLTIYTQEQEKVIERALHDYHKAQDLTELGEQKSKIINDIAQDFKKVKNLTALEKAELNKEIAKIKFADAQIKKLNIITDPLKKPVVT